jgi:hypothetical protein
MNLSFLILLGLSIASFGVVFKYCDQRARAPYLFFTLPYLVTTVIGATYIGLSDSGIFWRLSDPTLDTSLLAPSGDVRYWFLLYAPFFVPILPMVAFCRGAAVRPVPRKLRGFFGDDIDAFSFSFVALFFIRSCIMPLAQHGYLSNIGTALQSSGDYQSLIATRTEMMNKLDADFYGVIYIALPALSIVALYQWVRGRGSSWAVLFAVTGLAEVFFILCTVQKAPLFVYAFSIVACLLSLGVVRVWLLVLLSAGFLSALTFLQTVFIGDWSILQSIVLIVFRMAGSFPYYLSVYPKQIPYMGMNFGLGLLGWGITLDDNTRVFDYMYPQILWVQGAAAAPAHVRAFAQGGPLAAVLLLLLIGGFIAVTARLKAIADRPLLFALYVQCLVCLYFLTQTSLRGALLESYGLKYAVFSLGSLWLWRKVVKTAVDGLKHRIFVKPGTAGS